jgi:hypothetical protein
MALPTPNRFTEDSPEVELAAKALARFYENDVDRWDEWIGGAVVALNAAHNTYPAGR